MSLTKVSYSMINGAAINILDYGAVSGADSGAAIQLALNAITANSVLVIPSGTYIVSQYLTISNKSNFSIVMEGVVIPTGILNTLASALFDFNNCSNFQVEPNIVNASYASTLNCFQLTGCTNVTIHDGLIDVKYNTLDGSAAVNIRSNTTEVVVRNNTIRSGYGVLVNSAETGVSNIQILNNNFVGQVAYGNTGPGDAVEINAAINGVQNVTVSGNTFSGYSYINAGRNLVCGFSNVSDVLVSNNKFTDVDNMICIHFEDGTNLARAESNIITSGIVGINIACNTTKNLVGISASNNTIQLPTSSATYSNSVGITAQSNQLAGGGEILGLQVIGNVVETVAAPEYGILINDHRRGVITNNIVSGFATGGIFVYSGNVAKAGIYDTVIKNNTAYNNTINYRFARGALGDTYSNTFAFEDVIVQDNICEKQGTFDYISKSTYGTSFQPSSKKIGNGITQTVDNTAKLFATFTIPNVATFGQIEIAYTCATNSGSNRVVESGKYMFTVARQAGSNVVLATSSKFGNSQVAKLGTGTITVTLSTTAVSGGVGADNTFSLQYTCADGTANPTKSGSDFTYNLISTHSESTVAIIPLT